MFLEGLKIVTLPGKGRCLVATRSYQTGDVIFSAKPYAAVAFDSHFTQVCHSCFRSGQNLLRCGRCGFAFYCDRTCRQEGWPQHSLECADMQNCGLPTDNVRLVARILRRVIKDSVFGAEGEIISPDRLETHIERLSNDERQAMEQDVTACLQFCPAAAKHFDTAFILQMLQIVNLNSLILTDQSGVKAMGVGLFPTISLLNHDCWPNCCVTFNNGNRQANKTTFHSSARAELRVMRAINADEELTVSYLSFVGLAEERRAFLLRDYFFECNCVHCQDQTQDTLLTAAKVRNSPDVIISDAFPPPPPPNAVWIVWVILVILHRAGRCELAKVQGTQMWKLRSREQQSKDIDAKQVAEDSKHALGKVDMALAERHWDEVWSLCKEALDKHLPVLADTNIYLLRMLSAAAEAATHNRELGIAAIYAARAVTGYRDVCHPKSPQLLDAFVRAGALCYGSALYEDAHTFLCEALAILIVTHGATHARTKYIQVMKVKVEREIALLRMNEVVPRVVQSERALERKSELHGLLEPYIKTIFPRRY
ncbi:unnamed protein product [Lampetra planeri]